MSPVATRKIGAGRFDSHWGKQMRDAWRKIFIVRSQALLGVAASRKSMRRALRPPVAFACMILMVAISLTVAPVFGQGVADAALLAQINKIKAIDNHAHPQVVLSAGQSDDNSTDYVAVEPIDPPVLLRPDNPKFMTAWRSLFGYPYHDAAPEHLRELTSSKQRIIAAQGDNYAAWVLDRLGIDVMLSNRVGMGRGLTAPRFRWVPYVDALLYPLNNETAGSDNPDYRAAYVGLEKILKQFLADSRQEALPASLDSYLANVVTPTLERLKGGGAIALKFDSAYIRSLSFDNVPRAEAARIYAQHVGAASPARADYKALQDHIVRYMAGEAGRLGLPVHIHVGAGASSYFNQVDANPFLLETLLNDPKLRQTRFVLLHGGLPNAKETRFLLYKPNVYADFSAQAFLTSTRELSEMLRSWLEFVPEKVLFGTDAFPVAGEIGWEEVGWLTATSGREALALALTGMLNDGEISRERALELATMVMRGNAVALYHLQAPEAVH